MKTEIAVILGILLTTINVSWAEEKVTGNVYVGTYNKYLFRGVDLSDNQWVVQGGIDLNYKNFTLSYWSNMQTAGTANYKRNDLNETDITLNYAFTPIELLSCNIGNGFYSYDSATVKDTNELYLKVTVNTLLSPTVTLYWDWDEAKKKGQFFTLSISHNLEVAKDLSINLGALAGYNMMNPSANAEYSNLHNYELTVCAEYSLTEKIKITPSYMYSNAFNATARNIGNVHGESVYGIKSAFAF